MKTGDMVVYRYDCQDVWQDVGIVVQVLETSCKVLFINSSGWQKVFHLAASDLQVIE